jgi:hypothetical protein
MWGRGVDEDVFDDNVLYPFNPKIHAAPIEPSGKNSNESSSYDDSPSSTPAQGMRVKVRYDKNESHYGTITKATAAAKTSSKKSRKTEYSINILYDDESTEVATYPDPDIIMAMPGTFFKFYTRLLCCFIVTLPLCYHHYHSTQVPKRRLMYMAMWNRWNSMANPSCLSLVEIRSRLGDACCVN